eukprot:TRINITY_DN18766_c0_g1_i2.p1 TRINITY_DN18766_c0_g1~~TRINITY_DN18766_c0_g1_i2.p1  ORF type:complete len:590 (+),score=145.68 TRINITY_DN18766_c0_g1_i2:95-1864(+)
MDTPHLGRHSMETGAAFSPYQSLYGSPSRMQMKHLGEGIGMTLLEELEPKCSLWKYRAPLSEVRELDTVNSKYSDEFMVAGVPWRMHLQQRTDQQNGVVYLAVHLQCVHTGAGGTYGHFKITILNRDSEKSKGKNFHCHFKKPGSAWGLHHFIQLERLLNSDVGFIERYEVNGEVIPCIQIEILLKVIDPGVDGTYVFGQLPKPTKSTHHKSTINASLAWPEQEFTDMSFVLSSGEAIRAHKCIIASRCPKFFEYNNTEDTVTLSERMNKTVFDLFLRYVYSEETPEGRLDPETLIELYQLAAEHSFVNLAKKCLELCQPLITGKNVLQLITCDSVMDVINSSETTADSPLQLIFLRVLTTNYDELIQDTRFDDIPGKLNRKLSLIMRSKADLGEISFNPNVQERTLSQDLNNLSKTGAYSDMEVILPRGSSIQLHKVVLRNRAQQTQHWEGSSYQFPNEEQYAFSDETYVAFFEALYRGSIESEKEPITPELITLTLKMDSELELTNQDLKKECEAWVTAQNCLPLYVLSVRHEVTSLTDTSKVMLAKSFLDKLREEPETVWRLMEELPKTGLLDIFKSFSHNLLAQH